MCADVSSTTDSSAIVPCAYTARSHRADYHPFRLRNASGLMPVCLLNAVEKLPKFPKPRSSAISVIDFRVPNTSSTAAAITVLWAYRQDAHNMTGNLSSRIEVYLCNQDRKSTRLNSSP